MDLEKMMELPGALAAFTYSDKGDLQSHVLREGTELTPLVLELLARSCVANLAIASMEGHGWEALTGQSGFSATQGFFGRGAGMVGGGEWQLRVVVKNRDADYEATFNAVQTT